MCEVSELIKLTDEPRIIGALQELEYFRINEKRNEYSTFNNYQKLASRTLKCGLEFREKMSMLSMGLAGEAGEVVDLIKKFLYHGHDVNLNELKKELGDTLWYISGLATENGINLEEIMKLNIEKLEKRYPNGFNNNDSINRIDDKKVTVAQISFKRI